MDILFACPNCKQQLEADSALSGTSISCPSCGIELSIPEPDPANLRLSPSADDAAHKEEKHFVVPVTDKPTQSLIQKALPPLEVAARTDESKHMRIRCIRHTDCVEVGKDRFDEIVSDHLGRIGEQNIVSVSTFNYTHVDIGSQKLLTDYGVMIVYRG